MAVLASIPLARRPELLLGSAGSDGRRLVNDPRTGADFQIGEQEAFLLCQLDGRQTHQQICSAFAHRFGEALAEEELDQFLDLAVKQSLVRVVTDGALAGEETLPADEAEYQQRFAASEALYRRARQVIAGATTHDRRDFGPFPVFIERAEGPCKWDVSGRRFIDFWMGHGALLCGHNYAPVVQAIIRQARRGTHYGACHENEVRWAELVCALMPSVERVRFTASGTEATQLAMRVARAYTGRPMIMRFDGHFHGWHDEAMVHFHPPLSAGISPGAVDNVAVVEDGALESARQCLQTGMVAGVLLEPGGGSAGGMPGSREFLQALRQITTEHGSLLIFDEVISGFRHSPGGVQQVTGVIPDLTTLAKILCGGLPGGAVGGRADVMAVFGSGTQRGERWAKTPHTGTYNGNPLSAAAGIALLENVADGAAQEQARLAAERLVQGVNQAAADERVDVCLFANQTSIYHILIGARQAGELLGPSMAVKTLQASHPQRYAHLRRALLLEGIDGHPVHGWVSAVHDHQIVDEAVVAFARAFHRLRHTAGFKL